jgi:hypothetical protein
LRPGNAVGTLTVTNTATLAGNVVMELAPTNTVNSDRLVSGSTLTYGGVLTVTNVSFGGLTNGTYVFQLFSAPTITGSFDATNLPALPLNKSWDTSELAAGRIKLVVSVDTTPTNIVTALNGNSLQLTWPASHIGWRLQAQTNTTSVGLANNWVLVPNSDLTNTFTTSFNTSTNAVFYRMVFP